MERPPTVGLRVPPLSLCIVYLHMIYSQIVLVKLCMCSYELRALPCDLTGRYIKPYSIASRRKYLFVAIDP